MESMYIGEGEYGSRFLSFDQLESVTELVVENQDTYNRLYKRGCGLDIVFEKFASRLVMVDCFGAEHQFESTWSRLYRDTNPTDVAKIIEKVASTADGEDKVLVVIDRLDIFKPESAVEPIMRKLERHRFRGKGTSLKFLIIRLGETDMTHDLEVFETSDDDLAFLQDGVVTTFTGGESYGE